MNTEVRTPFGRLLVGYCIGFGPLLGSFLLAQAMLMTFKLQEVSPENYAAIFGIVVALGSVASLVGNPIGGAIGDKTNNRFGRRRTWIFIGSLVASMSLFLIGIADTVWGIVVLWFIGFFFMNFALVSYIALIPEQVPEEKRGRAAAFTGFSLPVSMIISTLLLIIVRDFSTELKWTLMAMCCFVGPVISLLLIKDGKVEVKKSFIPKKKKTFFIRRIRNVYPSPKKYPEFSWAIVSKFLYVTGQAGTVFLSMMFIERMGFAEEQAMLQVGIICIVSEVAALTSSLLSGILSDKFKKRRPFLYLGSILTALGLIIYGVFPTFGALLLGTMLIYSGASCYFTVSTTVNAKVLPNKEDTAKDLGILNISNVLPRVIMCTLFPLFVSTIGWGVFYVMSAIFVLLGIIAIKKLPDFNDKLKHEQ